MRVLALWVALCGCGARPPPTAELVSDDDRVHVRWLFARDDRQAGAATASIAHVQLALPLVVDKLVARHELARAAKRIASDTASPDAAAQVTRVMVAVLR